MCTPNRSILQTIPFYIHFQCNNRNGKTKESKFLSMARFPKNETRQRIQDVFWYLWPMQRWSAYGLIFSLLFPFLLKNGLVVDFHFSSPTLRQAECTQIKVVTCAGKCQLLRVMKKLPSQEKPASLPLGIDHELSPFFVTALSIFSEPENVSKSLLNSSIIAQVLPGFPTFHERPPNRYIG